MTFPPLGRPSGRPPVATLDLSDLLLVVILSLGSARLLGLLIGASAGPSDPLAEPAPGAPAAMVAIALFAVQSLILVIAIHLVVIRGRGLAWADLGLRRPAVPWVRRAVFATLAAFPLVGLVNAIVASLIGYVPENPQLDIVAPAGISWTTALAMLFALGVVVPIAEELMFRGLLFGWLRSRLGLRPAMAISALCFSLLHGIAWLIPAIFVLGLILAWVYEKSGSLWAAITTHGLFNMISTVLLFAAQQSGALPL